MFLARRVNVGRSVHSTFDPIAPHYFIELFLFVSNSIKWDCVIACRTFPFT